MENKETKARRLCFTVNNYTQEDLERLHALAPLLEKHCYISYGLEVGDETGTPHIQGYIELKSAQRYSYLQNYFDFQRDGKVLKFHVEKAIAPVENNRKYTQKDGNGFEYGEPVKQGSRTDLSQIKEAVKTAPNDLPNIIDDLVQNNQQLKYAENLQRYYLSHRDPANPPEVYWIYGQTGIGKTSLVFRCFKDICSVSSYDWLGTGYTQNECLLLDDFREFSISFDNLLKLTDRYPYTLFYKGGAAPLNSPYIVFTSPHSIEQTFRNSRENIEQLKRRITEIDLDLEQDINTLDLRNYPKSG